MRVLFRAAFVVWEVCNVCTGCFSSRGGPVFVAVMAVERLAVAAETLDVLPALTKYKQCPIPVCTVKTQRYLSKKIISKAGRAGRAEPGLDGTSQTLNRFQGRAGDCYCSPHATEG